MAVRAQQRYTDNGVRHCTTETAPFVLQIGRNVCHEGAANCGDQEVRKGAGIPRLWRHYIQRKILPQCLSEQDWRMIKFSPFSLVRSEVRTSKLNVSRERG
jgi:hypothetical protein